MTRDEVKEKIKEKFGTYSRFCKYAKIDRYEFQKDFLTARRVDQDTIDGVWLLFSTIDFPTKEFRMTILKIEDALTKAGGAYQFCKKNKNFNTNTIFYILSGKYQEITPGIKKLMKALKVKA